MLHTRLDFQPATLERLFADLEPLFDFYYPLATPYLRIILTPDFTAYLTYDLTEPSDQDLVLWGVIEEEQALILRQLEMGRSAEENAKRARGRKRGYYGPELLACRRPLVAAKLGHLRYLAPRARSVEEVSQVLYSEDRGYWLRHHDGSESEWGQPESLSSLIPGHP